MGWRSGWPWSTQKYDTFCHPHVHQQVKPPLAPPQLQINLKLSSSTVAVKAWGVRLYPLMRDFLRIHSCFILPPAGRIWAPVTNPPLAPRLGRSGQQPERHRGRTMSIKICPSDTTSSFKQPAPQAQDEAERHHGDHVPMDRPTPGVCEQCCIDHICDDQCCDQCCDGGCAAACRRHDCNCGGGLDNCYGCTHLLMVMCTCTVAAPSLTEHGAG